LQGDCPPLLLQPLIENALRHDLDCHEEKSDIHLNFSVTGAQVSIQLRNRIIDKTASNPGLGLGLSQTKTRLELMYQGAASMQVNHADDFFEVCITMPLYKPDQNEG
jgi:two-component system sensor histidine kinase AlgZ